MKSLHELYEGITVCHTSSIGEVCHHKINTKTPFESLKEIKGIKLDITETCLYNFDPLKPQFYIVKLGFTGVYISFLIPAQNIVVGTC